MLVNALAKHTSLVSVAEDLFGNLFTILENKSSDAM